MRGNNSTESFIVKHTKLRSYPQVNKTRGNGLVNETESNMAVNLSVQRFSLEAHIIWLNLLPGEEIRRQFLTAELSQSSE